jgi:chaperonin GroES
MSKGSKPGVPTIRPLEDRLLVKPEESEEKTSGGIYLPDTAKEKPTQGSVIAVGPGKISKAGARSPMSVKAGDRVLFSRYAGTEIKIGGEEYRIINESEVLAIID